LTTCYFDYIIILLKASFKNGWRSFRPEDVRITQKNYVGMSIALFAVLIFLFAKYLPVYATNAPLLMLGMVFLAMTVAITIIFCLVVITKRRYVRQQWLTLNRFRHLLFLMVKRDFVTRYRRSVLGVLWSLLNPLLTMLIMTMVFSHLFRFDIPNFPVYLLSGRILFDFFSDSTTQAMNSVLDNAGIIKKVYVPKYVFPVSRVLSSLVNLGFSFIAFLLVFIITRATFHWTILLVPIPIILLFIFSLGIGMILSSIAVFFRDMKHLYVVSMTLLMFLTPIFYPVSILPESIFHLIHFNPLFHFVGYFRALALEGFVPGFWTNIICIGLALLALCCGLYVMMTKQDKFILHL